jgi:putative hydrolase of the HAD superfamily
VLEAVTFDYWQTLVSERPGEMRSCQIERFATILEETGQPRTAEQLETAFAENWERFEEHWRGNTGQYTPTDTVEFVCGRLGIDLRNGLRERLIDGFREVGEAVHLDLAPGIEECLAELGGAGMRVGIVCDVGLTSSPTLRDRLVGFGLLEAFDAWAFSDETGWFKPAPEAFTPALQGLRVSDPTRVAHVGDNRRTDVAGALALGMVAVRYTGLGRDRTHAPAGDLGPEATHVIDDHRDLPAVLGLA